MKEHVFNMKDPIIVGMEVIEGNLRVGTPLCIPALGGLEIGRVTSIEQVLHFSVFVVKCFGDCRGQHFLLFWGL